MDKTRQVYVLHSARSSLTAQITALCHDYKIRFVVAQSDDAAVPGQAADQFRDSNGFQRVLDTRIEIRKLLSKLAFMATLCPFAPTMHPIPLQLRNVRQSIADRLRYKVA